jgi:hypothetical protein
LTVPKEGRIDLVWSLEETPKLKAYGSEFKLPEMLAPFLDSHSDPRIDPFDTNDSSTPFDEALQPIALPLAVDVSIESIGKADNYIDDRRIVVILGDPDNISRGNAAAALALELVSRPPHVQESVLRDHLELLSAKSLPKGAGKKSIRSWDGSKTPVDSSPQT